MEPEKTEEERDPYGQMGLLQGRRGDKHTHKHKHPSWAPPGESFLEFSGTNARIHKKQEPDEEVHSCIRELRFCNTSCSSAVQVA